jgi:hypothetical protein
MNDFGSFHIVSRRYSDSVILRDAFYEYLAPAV